MDAIPDAPVGLAGGLTTEQRAVATLGAEVRTLVTAAAGTGKTAVLVARLGHLIGSLGLSPGQGILVLSFTRSAVRVLRDRLAASGGDARYVRAATFDSFATRILSEFDPDGAWTSEDYDGRIRAATALINEGVAVAGLMAGYQHVLVDEIQDLVGDRAELVKAILVAAPGGFTLFGDPAQGIYNFQLDGEARKIGSQLLYRWIEEHWKGVLLQKTLSSNFRAVSSDTRSVLWAGEELCARDPDYSSIRFRLDTLMLGMPDAQPLGIAARSFVRDGKPTAILCRTNGEALVISRHLFEANVPHRLQRLATAVAVAPWIALVFKDAVHQQMGKRVFQQRVAELSVPGIEVPEPELAWKLLKRVDRRAQDDLRLQTIATAIRTRAMPDELTEVPQRVLTVSTIHRAKGLEFERVVVLDFHDDYADDDLTAAEETRVLYVGMTRPRSELMRGECPDTRGMSSKRNPGERWVRRRASWMTLGFEVRGEDLHSADPAGAFMVVEESVVDTQEYIAKSVAPGDELAAELVAQSTSGVDRAFYAVTHHGRVVGVTSEAFGQLLFRTLKINRGWKVTWPTRLEGLHVECVDTVAGTEAASQRAGLGVSGMWLRVRAFGLAKLRYPERG